MALDGSMDFVGNATGHGDEGTTKPLDTRQDTTSRSCSAGAGVICGSGVTLLGVSA
jgi:hypothetical protein